MKIEFALTEDAVRSGIGNELIVGACDCFLVPFALTRLTEQACEISLPGVAKVWVVQQQQTMLSKERTKRVGVVGFDGGGSSGNANPRC